MHKIESLKSNELLFLHQWYKETRLEATLLITLLSFFLFISLGTTLWAHSSGHHVALYATGYSVSAILLGIILIRSIVLYRFQWPTEPTLTLKTVELAISEKLLNERPTNESILEHFSDEETRIILPPHWKKSLPEGFNIQEKSLITIRAINLQQFFPSNRVPKRYKKGHLVLGFKERPVIAREWQRGLSQWRSTFARGMIFAQIALAGAATFLPLLQQGSAQNTAIITRLLYVYATLLVVVLMNLLFTLVRNRTISQRLSMHWDENSAAEDAVTQESLERLITRFIAEGRTIAVAESLTGGGIQKRITAISGVSAIFKGGVTAYSIESKVSQLSVDKRVAEEMNCVSAEISQQMAQGAAKLFNAEVTLATTGYAEKPEHPSAELEAPYAYVSLFDTGSLKTERIAISDEKTREEVQELICDAAIRLLVDTLTIPEEEEQQSEVVAIEQEESSSDLFEIALDTEESEAFAQESEAFAQESEAFAQESETFAQESETFAQESETFAQESETFAQESEQEKSSKDEKKSALPDLDLDLDLEL